MTVTVPDSGDAAVMNARFLHYAAYILEEHYLLASLPTYLPTYLHTHIHSYKNAYMHKI